MAERQHQHNAHQQNHQRHGRQRHRRRPLRGAPGRDAPQTIPTAGFYDKQHDIARRFMTSDMTNRGTLFPESTSKRMNVR